MRHESIAGIAQLLPNDFPPIVRQLKTDRLIQFRHSGYCCSDVGKGLLNIRPFYPGSQVHDLVGIRDLAPRASVRRDRLTPLNDGIDILLSIAKAARFPECRRNLTEVFLPFGCQLVASDRLRWSRASQGVQHPVNDRSGIGLRHQAGRLQGCQLRVKSILTLLCGSRNINRELVTQRCTGLAVFLQVLVNTPCEICTVGLPSAAAPKQEKQTANQDEGKSSRNET